MLKRNRVYIKNRIVIWVWSLVFRHWLENKRVIAVTGWRSAIVQRGSERFRMWPCFLWFK